MAEKTIDPSVAGKKPVVSAPVNSTLKSGAPASLIQFLVGGKVEVSVKVGQGKSALAKAFGAEPPAPTGYTIDRLVINLQVPNNQNQEIELAVRARAAETTLFYCVDNAWRVISGATKDSAGFLSATLPSWPDDPMVAAGH
jgi:hypothetical protein